MVHDQGIIRFQHLTPRLMKIKNTRNAWNAIVHKFIPSHSAEENAGSCTLTLCFTDHAYAQHSYISMHYFHTLSGPPCNNSGFFSLSTMRRSGYGISMHYHHAFKIGVAMSLKKKHKTRAFVSYTKGNACLGTHHQTQSARLIPK